MPGVPVRPWVTLFVAANLRLVPGWALVLRAGRPLLPKTADTSSASPAAWKNLEV